MYPQMHTNVEYITLTDMSNISNVKDENKILCKDLCKVGICISCFCCLYLFFFIGVIDSELNIDVINMTSF